MGILICLVCICVRADETTRVAALVTDLLLCVTIVEHINWAYDMEDFMDALGPGFWGIFLFLVVVACASKKRNTDPEQE